MSCIRLPSTLVFDRPGIYSYINPFSYYMLRKTGLLEKFEGVYIDGVSAVWMLRLAGYGVNRASFDMTSHASEVFEWASAERKTLFAIGSIGSDVELFVNSVSSQYEGVLVAGKRSGFFLSDEERVSVIAEIVNLAPDLVVCGMGAIAQERFMSDLRAAGWRGFGFTCGGFIKQTAAGTLEYYPKLVDKMNLRWAYRIYREPQLWRRYLFDYPKGLFFLLWDAARKRKFQCV